MGKTIQVIADRASRPDDLIAPGEVLDLKFRDGARTLTLRASKLLHLLVDAAGPDACADKVHSVPIEALNDTFHVSRDEFVETCRELFGTTVRMEIDTKRGRAEKIGPLLSDVERDLDDGDGSEVRFQLSPVLRLVLARSNHWAALSRRAVMAFESRYALRLYEVVAIRSGLSSKSTEVFTLEDLRSRLGVPPGKLVRWTHLRQFALDVAVAEVNQLSGFHVSYAPMKRGRSVTGVRLTWAVHGAQGRTAVARELEASRVGRKARREGTVEAVVEDDDDLPTILTFPRTGTIRYGRWEQIARDNLPQPTPDLDHVAGRFRAWAEGKFPMADPKIEARFIGFCRGWAKE
jgi:plasmid replication initiation protein